MSDIEQLRNQAKSNPMNFDMWAVLGDALQEEGNPIGDYISGILADGQLKKAMTEIEKAKKHNDNIAKDAETKTKNPIGSAADSIENNTRINKFKKSLINSFEATDLGTSIKEFENARRNLQVAWSTGGWTLCLVTGSRSVGVPGGWNVLGDFMIKSLRSRNYELLEFGHLADKQFYKDMMDVFESRNQLIKNIKKKGRGSKGSISKAVNAALIKKFGKGSFSFPQAAEIFINLRKQLGTGSTPPQPDAMVRVAVHKEGTPMTGPKSVWRAKTEEEMKMPTMKEVFKLDE
jgi:hypothetical protein